ncbi:MAG: glutathione S-transferase N-terminal domain-containing protein [Sphingomonadales bacterium]
MQLYELVLDRDRSVSPFVWRAKLALAHKGFSPDRIAIGYGDKARLAFSGQDRVPVLVDGDAVVSDSWRIACHLEDRYPDRPSLFGGEGGRALARLFNHWCDTQQLNPLFMLCCAPTFDLTPEADQPYYRRSRFEWTGLSIEQIRERGNLKHVRAAMEPLRLTLSERPFLAGEAPAYADYCAFGGLMWARMTVGGVLEPGDPVEDWRQRMLDLFGGLARRAPSAEPV